jgi:putative transposase
MPNKANSLSHTKWILKYHIVFTPKYRRKIIYNQYRKDLSEILRQLCHYKGVELIDRRTYDARPRAYVGEYSA